MSISGGNKITPEILEECLPQIEQLERIAEADQIALEALKNPSKDLLNDLKSRLEVIELEEKSAKISETSARAFLTRAIEYLDRK